MKSAGYLFIPAAGTWNFSVRSDDGFRLNMGENNATVAIFDGPRAPGTTTGSADVPSPGYYHYDLLWEQGGGGAMAEFFANGPGQPSDTLAGDPGGTLRVYRILGQGATVSALQGQSDTFTVGTFSAANLSASTGDFTATVSWGDTLSSPGTLTPLGNGRFSVKGTHAYTSGGPSLSQSRSPARPTAAR